MASVEVPPRSLGPGRSPKCVFDRQCPGRTFDGINCPESIPSTVGRLTDIVTLDLDYNRIKELPTHIGKLKSVTFLSLNDNSLHTLPTQIGEMDSLKWLEIWNNKIVSLPTELGKLPNLRRVDAWNNPMEEVPSQVGQLRKLTRFQFRLCSHLRLIPTELGNLVNITQLNFTRTNLSYIPTEIGKLDKLELLDLSRSNLYGLPSQIAALSLLEVLRLNQNNVKLLSSEIGRMRGLRELDLSHNNLEELPTQLGNLQLTSLNLDGNSIRSIPTELTNLPLSAVPFITKKSPENVTATFISSSEVRVEYSHEFSSGIDTYEVQLHGIHPDTYNTKARNSMQKSVISTTRFVEFLSLKPETTYYVIARAKKKQPSWLKSPIRYGNWSRVLVFKTCPLNLVSRNSEKDSCFAGPGYYKSATSTAESCDELSSRLPQNAIVKGACSQNFLTVQNITLSKGFWRASMDEVDVRRCPIHKYCQGTALNSSFSPNDYCSSYHTGIYCSDCLDKYVLGPDGCFDCSTVNRSSTAASVAFAFLAVVVWLFAHIVSRSIWISKSEARNSRAGALLVGGAKARIFFGYIQVLSAFQRTFQRDIAINHYFFALLDAWSSLAPERILEAMSARCLYDYDHYGVLLVSTITPVVIIVLLYVLTLGLIRCHRSRNASGSRFTVDLRRSFQQVSLFILSLVYPGVSHTILSTFWCEEFPNANSSAGLTTSALQRDSTVTCHVEDDVRRHGYLIYAGIMVIVYPIGVLVLFGGVLWKYRRIASKEIDEMSEAEVERLAKVSYLIKPYRPKAFWFESYELVRKLIQTSMIAGIWNQGARNRLYPWQQIAAVAELNLCFVLIALLFKVSPYRYVSDLYFCASSLFLLALATQLTLLDPYGIKGLSSEGFSVLVYTEISLFIAFILHDVARYGCLLKYLKRWQNRTSHTKNTIARRGEIHAVVGVERSERDRESQSLKSTSQVNVWKNRSSLVPN